MKFNERKEIVEKIMNLLKNNKLTANEKSKIYTIIMNIKNKTDKQKDRFTKFYYLQPFQDKPYTLSKIAQENGCSASAIRYSVVSMRFALSKLDENDILILKKITDAN